MHWSRTLGTTAVFLLSTMTAAANERMRLETRLGTVEIRSIDDQQKCAVARGRRLHCSRMDHLMIASSSVISMRDYVVMPIDEDCGGTACGVPSTSFIVLDATTERHTKGSFSSAWSTTTPRMQGANGFSITMPYQDGQIASMSFADGRFTFNVRETAGRTNVRPPDCSAMYEALGSCLNNGAACQDGLSGTSMADMRQVVAVTRRYEGLSYERIDAACRSLCRSTQLPTRAWFARQFCQRAR